MLLLTKGIGCNKLMLRFMYFYGLFSDSQACLQVEYASEIVVGFVLSSLEVFIENDA